MNKLKTIKLSFLLWLSVAILNLLPLDSFAQKNDIKLNMGIGIAEGFQIGTDLRFSWYSLGLNVGPINFLYADKTTTFNIDNRFYFLRNEKHAFETYYINLKTHFIFENTEEYRASRYVMGLAFGKDFELVDLIGASFDIGVAFPIDETIRDSILGFENINPLPAVIPELHISIYYLLPLSSK